QFFAMVCGNDHQGSIELAAPEQRVEKSVQALVEVGETVIVGVANQLAIMRDQSSFVDRLPLVDQERTIGQGPWSRPTAKAGPLGREVGCMGIEVVEESKEWPARLGAT